MADEQVDGVWRRTMIHCGVEYWVREDYFPHSGPPQEGGQAWTMLRFSWDPCVRNSSYRSYMVAETPFQYPVPSVQFPDGIETIEEAKRYVDTIWRMQR